MWPYGRRPVGSVGPKCAKVFRSSATRGAPQTCAVSRGAERPSAPSAASSSRCMARFEGPLEATSANLAQNTLWMAASWTSVEQLAIDVESAGPTASWPGPSAVWRARELQRAVRHEHRGALADPRRSRRRGTDGDAAGGRHRGRRLRDRLHQLARRRRRRRRGVGDRGQVHRQSVAERRGRLPQPRERRRQPGRGGRRRGRPGRRARRRLRPPRRVHPAGRHDPDRRRVPRGRRDQRDRQRRPRLLAEPLPGPTKRTATSSAAGSSPTSATR